MKITKQSAVEFARKMQGKEEITFDDLQQHIRTYKTPGQGTIPLSVAIFFAQYCNDLKFNPSIRYLEYILKT